MANNQLIIWTGYRKLQQWGRAVTDMRRVLKDALRTLERAARQRGAVAVNEWEFDRVFALTHLVIVSIHNVHRFAVLLGDRTHSAKIMRAVREFEANSRIANEFRDYLEHYDAYVRGHGKAQKAGTLPKPTDLGHITISDPKEKAGLDNLLGLQYHFGGLSLSIVQACEDAVRLSEEVLAGAREERLINPTWAGLDDERA